jgi:multidrug efflux pump subunit AcrA (membrane-fusion protein)
VRLQVGPAQAAVLVPKDAVARRAAQQVVFVVQEQTARMVPIKTGRAHAGWLEVLDGSLKPGDTVVITGNETLRDQAAVLIKGQASQ